MTALINTEHHGKIPARAGDIYHVSSCKYHCRLVKIVNSNTLLLKLVDSNFPDFEGIISPDKCTLLHRPFEIYDLLEDEHGVKGKAIRIAAPDWVDIAVSDDLPGQRVQYSVLRHANPAFRDHSLWEGE